MKFNLFSMRANGPGPRSVNPPKPMRSINKLMLIRLPHTNDETH